MWSACNLAAKSTLFRQHGDSELKNLKKRAEGRRVEEKRATMEIQISFIRKMKGSQNGKYILASCDRQGHPI